MKGKLCKHTIGLYFKQGLLEITSQIRSVPIGQKRKRGRPKNLPNCLSKSPVAAAAPVEEVLEPSEDVEIDGEMVPDNASSTAANTSKEREPSPEPVLRRSKRKAVVVSAGLKDQAPPKKRPRKTTS